MFCDDSHAQIPVSLWLLLPQKARSPELLLLLRSVRRSLLLRSLCWWNLLSMSSYRTLNKKGFR